MTIDERVRVLERRCQWLSAAAVVLAAGLGVGVLAGADRNKDRDKEAGDGVLKARGLKIVDEAGRVRIELGPADEGYGVIINDDTGAFRVTLTDAPAGAALQLRKGNGSIKMLVTKAIGPFTPGAEVSLFDGRGKQGAVTTVDEHGPKLRLRDAAGNDVFAAPGR